MKPESDPDDIDPGAADESVAAWMKLAAARRLILSARSAENPVEEPPFGFVARVAALASASRREAALSRWTRWSLGGALASALTALVVAAWPAPVAAGPPLLRPPAMEIPTLGSL